MSTKVMQETIDKSEFTNMKETPLNSILTSFYLIVILCLCSCSKDGMDGKEYEGYYIPIERIS